MDEYVQDERKLIHCRLRGMAIFGFSIVSFFGFADTVDAIYLYSGCSVTPPYPDYVKAFQTPGCDCCYRCYNLGNYIDRVWYNILDEGQYRYLDKGRYNLMAGWSCLLGQPYYTGLFKTDLDRGIGFTKEINSGRICSGLGQIQGVGYAVLCNNLNAGDYIDRVWYHYLDKGQYYYLDKEQYNLLWGSSCFPAIPYYHRHYNRNYCQFDKLSTCSAPEPSTFGFFVFGAFVIFSIRQREKISKPYY
jgi:hypothetical protein